MFLANKEYEIGSLLLIALDTMGERKGEAQSLINDEMMKLSLSAPEKILMFFRDRNEFTENKRVASFELPNYNTKLRVSVVKERVVGKEWDPGNWNGNTELNSTKYHGIFFDSRGSPHTSA